MATKKKQTTDEAGLEKQIGVRLSPKDYERLERLAVHMTVSTLARLALRIGLDIIEKQPGVVFGEEPKRR